MKELYLQNNITNGWEDLQSSRMRREVSPPPAAAGIAGNRHLKVAGRVLPIKEEKTIRKQGWNKKVA